MFAEACQMHGAAINVQFIADCVYISIRLFTEILENSWVTLRGCPLDDTHIITVVFKISSSSHEHFYAFKVGLVDC